jgi:hypothetical protein
MLNFMAFASISLESSKSSANLCTKVSTYDGLISGCTTSIYKYFREVKLNLNNQNKMKERSITHKKQRILASYTIKQSCGGKYARTHDHTKEGDRHTSDSANA